MTGWGDSWLVENGAPAAIPEEKPYSEKQKINQQRQPPLDQCCVHLYAQTSDLKPDWHWLLSILSPLFRSQQEL